MNLCALHNMITRLWYPFLIDTDFKPFSPVSVLDLICTMVVLSCIILLSPLILVIYVLWWIVLGIKYIINWLDSIELKCG